MIARDSTTDAASVDVVDAAMSTAARRSAFPWRRMLPCVGPLLLFVLWDLVVRLGLIKAILLPTPATTVQALVMGLAGGGRC